MSTRPGSESRGGQSLLAFLATSTREDVVHALRLYFSPFVALGKDFHDSVSDGQERTRPNGADTESKAPAE